MTSTRSFMRVSANDAPAWLAAHPDALILDARDAQHHANGHMPGSVRLDGRNHERLLMSERKDRPVFIYCYHGNASQTYAHMFADFGFREVCDLIGGWEAWRQSGASLVPAKLNAELPADLQAWLTNEKFADAHAPGSHGNTPLMHAAWLGKTDMVTALLAQGASLKAVNNDGNNALWLACVSNNPAVVIQLAKAGVPLDHQNLTGASCLMYAASSSKPDMVRTLLALGADPTLQTQDDFSALDMAATVECLQLLRSATRSLTT